MMEDALPVLISIPHGGRVIPDEFRDITLLTPGDVFDDGDPLTRDIYDFKHRVRALIAADVGRAFVDLNRKASDLPPENPDGVLKLFTLTGKSVYKDGAFPDMALREKLLDRYYHPYHRKIDQARRDKGIRLGLDCHSMLPNPPFFSGSPREKRPMICLSNAGNAKGESIRGGRLSCPPPWIRRFAECLSVAFVSEKGEVRINTPFQGGYITRHHSQTGFPFIQLELNRDLYLSPPWYDPATRSVSTERITRLNAMIWQAVRALMQSV